MPPESFENGTIHTFRPRIHGETGTVIDRASGSPFHPRIRGGDRQLHNKALSSPHTRGKPSSARVRDPLGPFIPAYTGETLRAYIQVKLLTLSSPHTRGKLPGVPAADEPDTFIPAYTGETLIPPRGRPMLAFHPRIHGGNVAALRAVAHVRLSSPHTRGKPSRDPERTKSNPFIPAYTGETGCRPCCSCRPTFHPRIHGGNATAAQ